MKSIRLHLLLLLSVAYITSCKKPVPKQTMHIPKNAVFVASLQLKSLQSKLVKNQATIENIVKSIAGNDTTASKGKQEWEDLKASGIDLEENLYLSFVNKGGGMTSGKGTIITSAIGALKDGAKLEAYVKKKDPSSVVRKEKDYSYTSIQGDNMVAWGKEVVIFMSYQKSFSPGDMEYDSITGSYNLRNPGNVASNIKEQLDMVFNLKEDQSVAAIPEFRDLMQEKADASMWVNSSASMEDLPLPLPKLKELFSNSFTAAKMNFDDGKISLTSKSYYSNQLRDILKQSSGSTADLSLIENYPSENINGFAVFSFNPDLINQLVKYLEVGGMVDAYLTRMMGSNYTLQEALKAIKGDFAVVMSDLAANSSPDNTAKPASMPDMKLLLNIPVGDKLQMNKLMDKLVEMQMLIKSNNEYRLTPNLQRIGYQLSVDDKNLIIASDETLLTQYRQKSKKAKLNNEIIKDFAGKSGVAYVDIESILNGIQNSTNGQPGAVLAKAKETFKDMKGYTENFNGKFIEGHGEVRFKNEKENSLTSLLSFIETVSRNMKNGPGINGDAVDLQADSTNVRGQNAE